MSNVSEYLINTMSVIPFLVYNFIVLISKINTVVTYNYYEHRERPIATQRENLDRKRYNLPLDHRYK